VAITRGGSAAMGWCCIFINHYCLVQQSSCNGEVRRGDDKDGIWCYYAHLSSAWVAAKENLVELMVLGKQRYHHKKYRQNIMV
jgi:hypothetical protein